MSDQGMTTTLLHNGGTDASSRQSNAAKPARHSDSQKTVVRAPKWTWIGLAASLVIAAALIVAVESHHAIPAFRTWTFAIVFAFFVSAVVWTRGWAQNVFLVFASFAFCLTLLEGVCTALEPAGSGVTITPGWAHHSDVIGWEPATPGSVIDTRKVDPKTGTVIYDAHYTIDQFRDRATASAASGPAVVFFGDSYTYGDGLPDSQTLPQQFADLLGRRTRTLNLAISGYSPQQFLREVETGYKDDVIGGSPKAFVFLTAPFHAARTSCKEPWVTNSPRYELVADKITWVGRCDTSSRRVRDWFDNSAAYRRFLQPTKISLTHEDVALYIRTLSAAVRLSHERYGVQTLVPYLAFTPDYLDGTGYTDAQIKDELRQQGVTVVDMSLPDDPLNHTAIPGDGHPTAYANAIRAKMVADNLRTMGVALEGAP